MLLILALNSPIQEKNKLKENLVIIENEKKSIILQTCNFSGTNHSPNSDIFLL